MNQYEAVVAVVGIVCLTMAFIAILKNLAEAFKEINK